MRRGHACRPWTKDEEQIIREEYVLHGAAYVGEMLNRSVYAVTTKASAIGVHRSDPVEVDPSVQLDIREVLYVVYSRREKGYWPREGNARRQKKVVDLRNAHTYIKPDSAEKQAERLQTAGRGQWVVRRAILGITEEAGK